MQDLGTLGCCDSVANAINNNGQIAGAAYILVVGTAQGLMPDLNEVTEQFPAVLLWQFRLASLGMQMVMWATIGLLFGALTERAASHRGAYGNGRLRMAGF